MHTFLRVLQMVINMTAYDNGLSTAELAEVRDLFDQEIGEILDSYESAISRLNDDPSDHEIAETAREAVHRISGDASMAGLAELGAYAKGLERLWIKRCRGTATFSDESFKMLRDTGVVLRRVAALEPIDLAEEFRLGRELLAELASELGLAIEDLSDSSSWQSVKDKGLDHRASTHGSIPPNESPKKKSATGRPTIVIVADSDLIRSALTLLLSEDYVIVEAASSQEGLETARKVLPSLILVDLDMVQPDGRDFAWELADSDDSELASIPMILMGTQKREGLSLPSSARAVVTIPISGHELCSLIDQFLTESNSAPSTQVIHHD